MGLGETKRKTRLVGSAISKNSAWTNDASLPGQRLLSSMGWSQGQGLGTSSQGTSVPITMAFKLDNKGIGAKRFEKEARVQGKADAWIGGGGELGGLFERLNNKVGNSNSTVTADRIEEVEEGRGGKKKSKKDKGEKRDRKEKKEAKSRKGKGREEEEEEEAPDQAVVEEAVQKVASALPHRMAHRARFLRAKRMVGNDLASVNEILGIASSSGSSSPAPKDVSPVAVTLKSNSKVEGAKTVIEVGEEKSEKKKGKRKRSEEVEETVSDDKKARRDAKRKAKEAKKERKDKKRKDRLKLEEMEELEAPLTVPMEPSSDPSFKAGGGMKVSSLSVQDYLQNKLIKRRAALVRQRREEAAKDEANLWKRAAMVSA